MPAVVGSEQNERVVVLLGLFQGSDDFADYDDMRRFLAVIENVGAAARAAFERGVPSAEAAAEFALPESMGEWFMFSPRYHEVAFTAWYRELSG